MKILNVVEIFNGSVLQIISFVVQKNEEFEKVVEEGEKLFTQILKDNNVEHEDIDKHIENGFYDDDNGFSVCLTWSL